MLPDYESRECIIFTIFEGRNPHKNECHINDNVSEKADERMSTNPKISISRRNFCMATDVVRGRVPIEQRLVNMKEEAPNNGGNILQPHNEGCSRYQQHRKRLGVCIWVYRMRRKENECEVGRSGSSLKVAS